MVPLSDLRTESEEFNRRFDVRAADRRFANALLDQRMMAWLLEQAPDSGFEIVDGRLMVFRARVTASLDDVARALELADGFSQRVPRSSEPAHSDGHRPRSPLHLLGMSHG